MKIDAQREVTALILAGGAGRRMGGRDKGLIEWRGKPLALHAYERISPQVERVLISCNRNREQYAEIATLAPPDQRENFQGPLAGLEAATPAIESAYLLVVPCDMPLLPQSLASRLADTLAQHAQMQACYATTGEDNHYTCALLRTACLKSLPEFLNRGGRAVRSWYRDIGATSSPFDPFADQFLNLNQLD